jgi:hypothetical protein
LLLWLLLWPTVQPYWMLPYGLRFGALLLTPVRHWGWLLGAELAATAGINALAQGMPLGWSGFHHRRTARAAGDGCRPVAAAATSICMPV